MTSRFDFRREVIQGHPTQGLIDTIAELHSLLRKRHPPRLKDERVRDYVLRVSACEAYVLPVLSKGGGGRAQLIKARCQRPLKEP
jgi:hypothetical protein